MAVAAAPAEKPLPPAAAGSPAQVAAPTVPAPATLATTPSSRKTTSTKSVAPKTQASKPGAPPDGLPTDETINEKTLEDEPPNPAIVGENTEQLSDVSDGEDGQDQRTASRNALSTWYRRIQPLVRNKRVRVFAIINTILTLLNLMLFIGCMVILGFLIFEAVEVSNRSQQDKPCIYQWTEWSACPATCSSDVNNPPTKTRQVNKSSIIQARGSLYKACPKNLESKIDYAPCNTHLCPVKLSTFPFSSACFRTDVTNVNSACYQMRDMPIGDYLVEIDEPLTRNCTCTVASASADDTVN